MTKCDMGEGRVWSKKCHFASEFLLNDHIFYIPGNCG